MDYRKNPEMPEQIPEMIRIAEILSESFPHVRVDLYLLDSGEIRFGEMTFTTSAGFLMRFQLSSET